ncbi:apoptosis-associated speck-like protein containing a CARD [Lepisosteus oculatus]|uniref:apoptosis-associated speck-like protein containing a CARD n=1 Tax=Lepisosteus oculatus TaxID=7918 RepID=UPI00371D0FFF
MAKSVKDHILETLEDLEEKDLKKFKNKLCDREGEPKVPRGRVQKADAIDLVNLLVSYFTERGAAEVAIEVLRAINLNQEADELKAKFKMPKTIKDHIIAALEDIGDFELKRFKAKLCDGQDRRIRRGAIENGDQIDLAEKLISTYTEKMAVKITIDLLRAIDENQAAEDLQDSTKELMGGASTGRPPAGAAAEDRYVKNGVHFVDRHRSALIQRVTMVEPILDALLTKKYVSQEEYSLILEERTPVSRMRALLTGPMVTCGKRGQDELCRILEQEQPILMEDLMGQ